MKRTGIICGIALLAGAAVFFVVRSNRSPRSGAVESKEKAPQSDGETPAGARPVPETPRGQARPRQTAGAAIGVASTIGSFTVDKVRVSRQATLVEGSRVETGEDALRLMPYDGGRLELDPASRASVFRRRLELDAGTVRLSGTDSYVLDVLGLRVVPADAGTSAAVTHSGEDRFTVTAYSGSVRVTRPEGTVIAEVKPGKSLEFQPTGRTSDVSVTGTLESRSGKLQVKDETTGVTVDVTAPGLEEHVSKRVQIAGQKTAETPQGLTMRPTDLRPAAPPAAPPQDEGATLKLLIVEGEGAINNIRQRLAREPIVQVVDENNRPVPGVAVTFTLPARGAGALFPNGARTLTVLSDQQGRAVASGMRPNSVVGKFQVQISASHAGQTASVAVTQTNVTAAAAAGAGSAAAGTATAAGSKAVIAGVVVGGTTAGTAAVVTTVLDQKSSSR